MSKRKASGEKPPRKEDRTNIDDDEDSDGDSTEILDIDFEWCTPGEVDFHGLKLLLRQLFDVDNDLLDLSELTNLILSQSHVGSTVKCEGDEEGEMSDPYAFMTVLNLSHYREKPAMAQLIRYLISIAAAHDTLKQLQQLLAPDSKAQVGLILGERFINMPHQIVPPLYTQLDSEIAAAAKSGEPFAFTHYLVFSRTYIEVASQLDMDVKDDRPQKKKPKKGGKGSTDAEVFYFHPEDEVLQKAAMGFANFEYTKQGGEGASDAKRAFQEMGVKPQGLMILLEAGRFKGVVREVEEYLSGES
ncbi:Mss4p nuclear export [Recurvomyces mirabilis]|uniref:Protein BCP1 n=1 Tax=Recurvomyces mirabilis TaxID=574656 RepID=A0AAE0WUA1_9PEZI|nr:Mss4p nuclear export [Recurvomyces mirabilis]KAK5160505.1 Mss4p nuclear export [Recurvomyces mirabilis]